MKAKFSNIIILFVAILALGINAFFFYMPNIKGDYSIYPTQDGRLQMSIREESYLEVFYQHDHWKSTEEEYHVFVRGEPRREVVEEVDFLTKKHNKIYEEVENDDVKVETTLEAVNTQNFQLRRKYEIKNELLLEDLDELYMQIVLNSEFYSYTQEESRLNFTGCRLIIEKPGNLEITYLNQHDLLLITSKIHEDMKRGNNTFTINLSFNIDCE